MRWAALILTTLVVACGHVQKQPIAQKSTPTKSSGYIEKIQNQDERILQLKEENLALKSLLEQERLNRLGGHQWEIPLSNPVALYQFVEQAYYNSEYKKFESAVDMFLTQYRHHSKVDDLLFLKAEHAFNTGEITEALRLCKLLDKKFPLSNKRVKYLSLTTKIYKRLNLFQPAEIVMNKIKTQYPRSKEAKRL